MQRSISPLNHTKEGSFSCGDWWEITEDSGPSGVTFNLIPGKIAYLIIKFSYNSERQQKEKQNNKIKKL